MFAWAFGNKMKTVVIYLVYANSHPMGEADAFVPSLPHITDYKCEV